MSPFCLSISNCWGSVFPLRQFCTEQIFVLVSIIILVLGKWNFKSITNFVNCITNVPSYQNTNKVTFHSNSLLFACFSIVLECCKYARMRFHCATVLVVLSICALRGNIADDAMQMDVHKALYPFYTTKEMPHVTVTITKNASLAAIVTYISITTNYTVGYLQIFNAGNFFSRLYFTQQAGSDILNWTCF